MEGALGWRAEEYMAKHGVTSVIIAYNATTGLPNDIIEASMNTVGFELADGAALKGDLIDLFSACAANGIEFAADFVCHSQGVAICRNILDSPEFSDGGSLGKYRGEVRNLGGPVIVPDTINCFAFGDPVFLIALANLPALARAIWNGELLVRCPVTVEFPHNFSAYQAAFPT